MSKHKVTATRHEVEHEITFEYRPGRPAVMYLRNGDPGYPADPDDLEVLSVSPGAGDCGAFSDGAQLDLIDWAQEWIDGEGLDEAMSIVVADSDAAREYRADCRREFV